MPPLLAIALGDINGIGPEVTLKALAAEWGADDTRYLLIGDEARARRLNEALGTRLPLQRFTGPETEGRILIHEPAGAGSPLRDDADGSPGSPEQTGGASVPASRLQFAPPPARGYARPTDGVKAGEQETSPAAAQAAMVWLKDGAERCWRGEAAALVTAPVSKEAIIRAGHPDFVGQTEFLAQLAGVDRPVMMLLGPDERERWLRVALATTHVPLKNVAAQLTREKVARAIELAAQACHDLGLPRAKVAVCGLNPHAGEGGKMGDEEQTIITPAVEAARQNGLDVAGPFAADALFHYVLQGDYDAVVAMYHDQGLVPLKMVAFEQGVNWTLGLPFIRTSPDHGTAFDIAGRGVANPSSMIAALRLAKQLARRLQGVAT